MSRDPTAFALNGEGCNTGGNSQSEVQAGEGDRITTITVMPCAFWSWGNIVVSLDGMTAPIIFQVASGANQGYAAAVDMGVTVRLPGASPMKPQRPAGYAAAPDDAAGFRPDSALSDFLNGTPPKAARSAKVVGGGDAAAWIYGGALYLQLHRRQSCPPGLGCPREAGRTAARSPSQPDPREGSDWHRADHHPRF